MLSESSTADDAAPNADEADRAHLADVEDGCGCAEVWEHLSERRMEASAAPTADD